MGSDFWDTLEQGADAGIEVMGEDVEIGGTDYAGIVEPVEVTEGAAAGGKRKDVTMVIQVTLEAGDAIEDGMAVLARALTGKVLFKEHFGGGWKIHVGKENRWEEDY
jgi:hypothetical protein